MVTRVRAQGTSARGAGPGRQGGLRRAGVALLLLGLVATVALLVRPSPQLVVDGRPDGTLPAPEPGDAVAIWIDEDPVLVVHDRDGELHAVDARVHYPGIGVHVAVRWCRPAQALITARTGTRFAPHGQWIGGRGAPPGLGGYETERIRGEVAFGDRLEGDRFDGTSAGTVDGPVWRCLDGRVDPAAVVQHDLDAHAHLTPEEAAAAGTAERRLVHGSLVLREGEPARLCAELAGSARRSCSPDAPPVDGLQAPEVLSLAVVETGVWRAALEDGRVTRLTLLEGEEGFAWRAPSAAEPPSDFGHARSVLVGKGFVQVPALDRAYGEPLAEPLAAGVYELRLDNHAEERHTLVNTRLGVQLEAEPGMRAATDVELDPGEHVFHCALPGHRAAGMQVRLRVD